MAKATVLAEYTDDKRLAVYKMLTAACGHLYSKGKLQMEKFSEASKLFADLSKNDPLFMAHFTAWAMRQDSKDQKVLAVFFNALSDADGLPFFKGSELCKPNYRQVSSAALQSLDPHLAARVLEFCTINFGVKGILNDSRHFPTALKTAFRKYVLFRESRPDILRGIRNSGNSSKMKKIYRGAGIAPADVAVGILKWNQKDGRKWKDFPEEQGPDFSKLTSKEITDELGKTKLSPQVALSVIPRDKITAGVAAAILKNCTGNQVIVLYNWFSENGFLDVKAIKELFKDKVKEATTAVDRIDTLTRDADEGDKEEMATVRSDRRKKTARTSRFGKIFMHIDKSGSMTGAIQFAKDRASIIAECIESPEKNFGWAAFTTSMTRLNAPQNFRKEGFHAALYGVTANGGTDCFVCYEEARRFGAEIDVFVTDQGHNTADFGDRVKKFHDRNPDSPKPRAVMIVHFVTSDSSDKLERGFKENGIPVVVVKPDSVKESALVAQSISTALHGEMATIDEIMDTPLPALPRWWSSVDRKKELARAEV